MKSVMKLIKNAFGKYEPQEVIDIQVRQEFLDLEDGTYSFTNGSTFHTVFVYSNPNSKLYMFDGLGLYINMDGSYLMMVRDGVRLNENFAEHRATLEKMYITLSTFEYKRV